MISVNDFMKSPFIEAADFKNLLVAVAGNRDSAVEGCWFGFWNAGNAGKGHLTERINQGDSGLLPVGQLSDHLSREKSAVPFRRLLVSRV